MWCFSAVVIYASCLREWLMLQICLDLLSLEKTQHPYDFNKCSRCPICNSIENNQPIWKHADYKEFSKPPALLGMHSLTEGVPNQRRWQPQWAVELWDHTCKLESVLQICRLCEYVASTMRPQTRALGKFSFQLGQQVFSSFCPSHSTFENSITLESFEFQERYSILSISDSKTQQDSYRIERTFWDQSGGDVKAVLKC